MTDFQDKLDLFDVAPIHFAHLFKQLNQNHFRWLLNVANF